jgi:hypothetical protein
VAAVAAIEQALAAQPAPVQEPSFKEWTQDYVRDNIQKLKATPPAAQPAPVQPVAWYEHNPDLDAWFLAYTHNPKVKSRPLVFGDTTPPEAQTAPVQEPVAWLEILRNNKTATDEVIGAFLRGHAEHLTGETFVLTTPPAAPVPITPAEVHGMAEAHGIDGDARHWYVVGITDSEKHHGITKGQP